MQTLAPPAVARSAVVAQDSPRRRDTGTSSISPDSTPPTPRAQPTTSPNTEQTSVLLVEDEADLRRLIRRRLERSGRFLVVGEARDGIEAIELATDLQPQILLLDLMMPRLDGRVALPTLVRRAPRTMVVVLSALQAADEEGPAISAGAFAYLEKTVLGTDLCEIVGTLHRRFQNALDGRTAWAPERPPGCDR